MDLERLMAENTPVPPARPAGRSINEKRQEELQKRLRENLRRRKKPSPPAKTSS
jgi:hypothetical protein